MEVWKKIEGLKDYKVSNHGRVMSIKGKKEKILKGGVSSCGYKNVNLSEDGMQKTRTIHQLVAIAFLNHNPSGWGIVVNHINFDKHDNRVENLEVITQRQNLNHRRYSGAETIKKIFELKSNGLRNVEIARITEKSKPYITKVLKKIN